MWTDSHRGVGMCGNTDVRGVGMCGNTDIEPELEWQEGETALHASVCLSNKEVGIRTPIPIPLPLPR